jgi:5-methyltetrahydropteroyltriglutamate--homocysteine methyltransferase
LASHELVRICFCPGSNRFYLRLTFFWSGANREVKKAVEAYWAGTITADQLTQVAADVKKSNWTSLKAKGVDHVPRFFVLHVLVPRLTVDLSGEFSLYDHVLDHSAAFNVIPKRYVGQGLTPLDVYFAMGRGRQANGVDVPASEMKKW